MTRAPNPNQIPTPNDQTGNDTSPLGFGHWSFIGIWGLGHWDFSARHGLRHRDFLLRAPLPPQTIPLLSFPYFFYRSFLQMALIQPHGGVLVNRVLDGAKADAAKKE